ncbi:MAG: N-acetylmuramic acid 6-phosphate etherase [Saprospiraceae bacterium]
MQKITETSSHYRHLEKMATLDLLENMNREDQKVPLAVAEVIPQLTVLIDIIVDKMKEGGRLFYVGAGTSGRLGVLDASECPPTYGVPEDWVVGLIAGGDYALRHSVEDAEDDPEQAWKDLSEFNISQQDVLIGIAASGTTPYVIGAMKDARERGITTGCITCNPGSPLAAAAEHPIEVIVGPEFVTGSTRMKSGTAQKLLLNMISTTVMIRMGRVKDNKMFDMQLSNNKLVDRGTKMVMQELGISYEEANALLQEHGSVRRAVEAFRG